MSQTTVTESQPHVPEALATVVREGVNFDSVKHPDGSIAMVDKRKPRAAKPAAKAARADAPAGRTDKAKAADKARTLDRVDPRSSRSSPRPSAGRLRAAGWSGGPS